MRGRGDAKIKYWHGSVPNIGIMLTKLSMQVGIKWPYRDSKSLVLRKSSGIMHIFDILLSLMYIFEL